MLSIQRPQASQPSQNTHTFLHEMAKRISYVNQPLILAGRDINQGHTQYDLIEFATQLQIPIITTVAAKNAIPTTHPLHLGTVDSPQCHRQYGFDWADLVLTIGCQIEDCLPQYWNPDGDIPIFHIGTTPTQTTCHYTPQLNLSGNLSALLHHLLRITSRQDKPSLRPPQGFTSIKVHDLAPEGKGSTTTYKLQSDTLQLGNQTLLMEIASSSRDNLSIHHFRTNQLHVVKGSLILVVLQNARYEYIALSAQRRAIAEIPPGTPHCLINFSAEPCLVVNTTIQHGTPHKRDSCSLQPPFPYDIAKALQALKDTQDEQSPVTILKAL